MACIAVVGVLLCVGIALGASNANARKLKFINADNHQVSISTDENHLEALQALDNILARAPRYLKVSPEQAEKLRANLFAAVRAGEYIPSTAPAKFEGWAYADKKNYDQRVSMLVLRVAPDLLYRLILPH